MCLILAKPERLVGSTEILILPASIPHDKSLQLIFDKHQKCMGHREKTSVFNNRSELAMLGASKPCHSAVQLGYSDGYSVLM